MLLFYEALLRIFSYSMTYTTGGDAVLVFSSDCTRFCLVCLHPVEKGVPEPDASEPMYIELVSDGQTD